MTGKIKKIVQFDTQNSKVCDLAGFFLKNVRFNRQN